MIQVAILGFGTVGSGVAEVLEMNQKEIARGAGEALCLKYILDTREFPDSPFRDRLIHDFSVVESDPDVKIVAECIGGVGVAYDFVTRCLKAGKHVVTSNKEMVAKYGDVLLKIAQEQGVNFLFEASVGGGIPILRPLMSCLTANRIEEICGILNGTTNYILTKMIDEGEEFDTVLKQAQEMGYAERDPSADVDGHDACRKICILADLVYGVHVDPEQVTTIGIRDIGVETVAFADIAKMRIKLLARVFPQKDGKLAVFVAPHFVPEKNQLAHVDDVFNAVQVRGNAVGDTLFYGRGAGKLPTASAVVGDMIDAAVHLDKRRDLSWSSAQENYLADVRDIPLVWFVNVSDGENAVRAALPEARILGRDSDSCGFLTEPMALSELEKCGLHRIEQYPVLSD
ncbi:MAG: homoserine dehydrogenase [Oscillospiraceae bacterium]|nr:homoserine dehydrogenase [Oscillospiraceae bacterium]